MRNLEIILGDRFVPRGSYGGCGRSYVGVFSLVICSYNCFVFCNCYFFFLFFFFGILRIFGGGAAMAVAVIFGRLFCTILWSFLVCGYGTVVCMWLGAGAFDGFVAVTLRE